jgi:hypothetical protein
MSKKTKDPAYMKAQPKYEKQTTTLLIKGLPTSVRDLFKSACAKRGASMSLILRQFMVEFTDRTENPLKHPRK